MPVPILISFALVASVARTAASYSDLLVAERVDSSRKLLEHYGRSSVDIAKAASAHLVNHSEVINAIKNKNHEEILRICAPLLDTPFINLCTVLDHEGVVLARVHQPERFGDSMKEYPHISHVLESGTECTKFVPDRDIVLSLRTAVPVHDTDGTLIGIIATGVRLDTNEAVDILKELLNAAVTVFVGTTRVATTIQIQGGHRAVGTQMPPEVAKVIFGEGKEYSGDVEILGTSYKTFYRPIRNARNEIFAAIFVGIPISDLKARTARTLRKIIAACIVAIAVCTVFLYGIISAFSKPLVELSKNIDVVEKGNLKLDDTTIVEDEVGRATHSLKKLVNTIMRLIDDINATIYEHTQGNVDYVLDISKFQGQFQMLASRINTLSTISMIDPLTGLPNRRSLDSRLKVEWHRAIRDRQPLSFLMIDIDHFKKYNDLYGHQHGDAVLRTIAAAIRVSVKRNLDFVARWGGEEFAVVLPDTAVEGVMSVAGQIRAEVERTDIPRADSGTSKGVTISIGVCVMIPTLEDTMDTLIAHADDALYLAKETGRNRVCLYAEAQENQQNNV